MKVLKQSIILILLSIGVVLAMSFAQQVLQVLISAHDLVSQALTDVFSGGKTGTLARGLIALLSIPVIAALIPTLIYWVLRRHWFPYFIEIVWIVWLIQTSALIVSFQS